MSSSAEILETFYQDIAEKTKQVVNRQGMFALLDNANGITAKELFKDIIDEEDRDLLKRIYAKDEDWRKDDKRLTRDEIIEMLRGLADD